MDYQDDGAQEQTGELGLPEPLDKKKEKKRPRFAVWKWVFFVIFLLYIVLTSYRVPLLIRLGDYLIVEHEARKADLIVCLGGRGVENALAAVDAYNKGLAPYIFRAKELEPDGLDYLRQRVQGYPTDFDLFRLIVRGFGIPEEVILSSEDRADSTIDEARLVRKLVHDRGVRSLILISTLTHSRRAWLTFKNVFEDDDIEIISLPSHYQLFDPKDWWTKRKYAKEVILEYQKLMYYKFAYGI